jgi:MoaA/NifB/PqqE/SkfB family radical SAM enzyme
MSTESPAQSLEKAMELLNSGHCAEALNVVDALAAGQPKISQLQLVRAACLLKLDLVDESETVIGAELLRGGRNIEMRNILSQIRQKRFSTLMQSIRNKTGADVSWVENTPMAQTSAVIYISELCNSRCVTCNAWKNKTEDQLSTETWIDILGQIRTSGFSSVEFVGGEPLIRRDLPELALEAKRLGFSTILVSSNGFLLDRKHIDNLIQHGVNSFHISIDGMRDTYKFVRGVDWFDKVLNAVRVISEREIPLLILTTLVRQNIAELETIVSMAERYGSLWFANILENMKFLFKGIDIDKIQILEPDEIDRVAETLNNIRAAHPRTCILREEDVHYIRDYLEYPNRESRVPCPLGFNESYFDARGNVYPGCMSLQPAGNAVRTPLPKIIDSSTMRSSLKAMLLRKCPGCTCGYPQRAQLMYVRIV